MSASTTKSRREPRAVPRTRSSEPCRDPLASNLEVRIGPMRLANPVLVASGTFGYGDEYAHVLDKSAM